MNEQDNNLPEENQVFKKFSPNSRKILISAQKIASNLQTAIGSEHILLALAITPGTLSQSILQEHMISLEQIRLMISLARPSGEERGLADDAKEIIKKAAGLAKTFSHQTIDPEHLLLALVSSKENPAYQIISRIGADPESIASQINGLFEDIREIESRPPLAPPKMPFGLPSFNLDELPEPDFHEQMPPPPEPLTSSPNKNILDYFTVNLTKQAEEGQIDPLIGRSREIERVIQILSRRTKNNPVLVGEPGVGKTAIVEGLAQKILEGNVPSGLEKKQIIMLDLALLVAGTTYRGQFEDRIKKVMEELERQGNAILFVDELHTVVGAGSAEGSLDAANILKPALAKGKIRLIGATTFADYRKTIEKDAALERRLQKVQVDEPSPQDTRDILKGLRASYEDYHGVKISDEAINAAVLLSRRYIADRFLPDKAIDLIDEAAAAWKLNHASKSDSRLKNLERQMVLIQKQKEQEVEKQNYSRAAQLKTLELRFQDEIGRLRRQEGEKKEFLGEIGAEEIARVVSLWTNIPVQSLTQGEKSKYLNLGQNLKKRVIGQDEAIDQISQAIRRAKTGIIDPNRPIGSFVFLGPTGVGKTELARVLATELFGSPSSLIKIDMSEFMERHNLSRLIGAPPGYVGYEEAGRLTEEVRQKPYSIVLFDEIEKAHPEVFNILLQILEDGSLTDAQGRKVNFRNTIIIMTSNIGVGELNRQAAIGFQASGSAKKKTEKDYEKMKTELVSKLKDELRPELVNRLDKIIVFHPLSRAQLIKIVDLRLEELKNRLLSQGIHLNFSSEVKKLLAEKGYEPQFGARPVRRAIADLIEAPLSEEILAGTLEKGGEIKVLARSGRIYFAKTKKKK